MTRRCWPKRSDVAEAKGLPRYQTLQNEYNLYTRDKFEGAVQDMVVAKEG